MKIKIFRIISLSKDGFSEISKLSLTAIFIIRLPRLCPLKTSLKEKKRGGAISENKNTLTKSNSLSKSIKKVKPIIISKNPMIA
jgi:hypothetical protein